jgi:formate dehydrogenase iron-sulfur subunit
VSTSAPPTEIAIHHVGAPRLGFFTDTSVCIGCKACEVACKQWNDLPADGATFTKGSSYDHTGELSASTWRHVRFIELLEPSPALKAEAEQALRRGAGGSLPAIPAVGTARGSGGFPGPADGEAGAGEAGAGDAGPAQAGAGHGGGGVGGGVGLGGGATVRDTDALVADAVAKMGDWVFMSDVCKHCTNAGCLDACPTGALIRTEHQTVVLQPDVCNGCGYCVPACPFGVVDRDPIDGRAGKCTLCYDRLADGMEPACAKSCPTDSIQFGPYDELVELASRRVAELQSRGVSSAYLYGAGDDPDEQLAGGLGAFFLLTEVPERYGLPAHAESPIQENLVPATLAGVGAGLLAAAGTAAAFVLAARRAQRRASFPTRRRR